jgi:AAA domain
MYIINLYGGPGAGKSTLAAYLFYRFKRAGFRTELVGEAARELIYDGQREILHSNQLLVSGMQYERLKRLQRNGMEIAIADSPLMLGQVYVGGLPEATGLCQSIDEINQEFLMCNVWIARGPDYDKEIRQQTREQAVNLDESIYKLVNYKQGFEYTVEWPTFEALADQLIKDLRSIKGARE